MAARKIQKVIKVLLIGIVAGGVFGLVVMALWNRLIPPIFGWHTVTFWQAVGLLVLSKILFGSFRGGRRGGGMHWRGRMREKWAQMSPEEREKFSQGMGARFGRGCWPEGRKAEL